MLFQPSNITPDEVTGSGCVDLTQGLDVSWQVNGDSAMTTYQIDIYLNDSGSTLKYSTNKVTLSTPFWGVNYKGETQFYTASITAAALSAAGMSNGNEYKLLITQWWSANDSIQQTTASVFLTRTAPTVSITAIPNPLTERAYSFTGSYTQAEGDAIKWLRWQICVSGSESAPFLDTGPIYGTGQLQVDYDGFFTGTSYEIMLSVETENGVDASTGWVAFSVSYVVGEAQGQVVACLLPDDGAVSVQWDQMNAAQGYDVYRKIAGESVLQKIASVDDTTGQLRDYGAASGQSYVYYVYPTGALAYLTKPMVSDPISVQFWFWTILETTQNADGSFAVEAAHFFRIGNGGVQEGPFSNNNAPQVSKNFTRYPTRQAETANYLTGSVGGYVGSVSQTKKYADTLAQASALRALSTTSHILFLLDPKGHFIRIATNGEISMSVDHKSLEMPQTVTIPWVEIESAENAVVVAAPGGDFYPVDEIIFTSVRVDPVSGMLYWTHGEDYTEGSTLSLENGALVQHVEGSFTAATLSITGNELKATL